MSESALHFLRVSNDSKRNNIIEFSCPKPGLTCIYNDGFTNCPFCGAELTFRLKDYGKSDIET